MQQHYDLIIGGGAMNGLTLALALSHFSSQRLKIAVVEKRLQQEQQGVGFDTRCVALSDGTCRKLAQIPFSEHYSLWDKMQAFAEPIKQVHISEQHHLGIVEINAQELHLSQVGAVVPLSEMGLMFSQALKARPNIDFICPDSIVELQTSKQQISVLLQSGQQLSAKLLVAADGSDSKIAELAKIATETVHNYQQTAIIANVRISSSHNGRAFERFTTQGPIALLPLADKMMSLVFCTKAPEQLLNMNDEQFISHLQQQFGWRLGAFQAVSRRYAYPLMLKRATSFVGDRIALVGNAAQTLHPVAGQGFNLGIRDVFALAKIVAEADEIGSAAMLQQYQQQRLADQQHIIGLTDNLVQIFSNSLLPLQILRNLGLIGLSSCALLRNCFVQPTLGRI
ncbi:2-octaprenyl-6-methoxyphenyl hydroxylase [Gallibacterium anatis]|uniref:2-octaprenyl-6-methoxyphenyl hydroxylase n=1 Tax=Gallibacterium anatis TaxID=750 RepID=UPI0030061267